MKRMKQFLTTLLLAIMLMAASGSQLTTHADDGDPQSPSPTAKAPAPAPSQLDQFRDLVNKAIDALRDLLG